MGINVRNHSILGVAFAGMFAFAAAIGVGRFAFTPLLPMMQKDAGLTLSMGAWLASANYLGYLVGALSAIWIRLPATTMLRVALISIVALTLAMGVTRDPAFWLVLRALAGVASAWGLIFASASILPRLVAAGQKRLSGIVFGGVGLGMVLAGGTCLIAGGFEWSSSEIWQMLGALALVLTGLAWPSRGDTIDRARTTTPAPVVGDRAAVRKRVIVVLCYGVFGFAYIVPATFLPAMARRAVADPAVFGWAWPVFGAAALASTLLAARLSSVLSNRRIWALGHLIMAFGVAVPLAWPGIGGIIAASLCVGGTFMVVTLSGLQEAQRLAEGNSARLIAGMTAAFATGQVLGPILIGVLTGSSGGLQISLSVASLSLVATAAILLRG
jgi:predicted MFS family arabinose efflux permease